MKTMLILIALLMVSCSDKSLEAVVTAKDGSSCSVASEYALNEETMSSSIIGARISCTDGSFSVILNGQDGANGIDGKNGKDGKSCQTYRSFLFDGVWLACPNQLPQLISDGKDGEDGQGCTSTRQKDRVKIQCGKSVSYVYDGETGATGASCTATNAPGGANVTCGGSTVFLANGATGPAGSVGPQGQPGRDGMNGQDGEDAFQSGLSCNVHDLSNWNGVTNILTVLAASAPVGNFVLPNLNVGDSPSANGFPGMPSALQNKVGLTGYALDCNGYLNIKTSGLYNFSMLSDDGVRLVIDNEVIINNPGLHAPTVNTASSIEIQRGQRAFNVIYYQGPHTQIALQLKYSGPNASTSVVIPSTEFTH
jgi:hypothetical protein